MQTSEKLKSRRPSDIQNQLFKSWTLSVHDNVTVHTLVALGKGRRVLELCSRSLDCSCFAATVAHVFAHVFAHVLPCGMSFEAAPLAPSHMVWEQVVVWHDLSEKSCQLVDFQQKRKVCGVTSARKVLTCRILAK